MKKLNNMEKNNPSPDPEQRKKEIKENMEKKIQEILKRPEFTWIKTLQKQKDLKAEIFLVGGSIRDLALGKEDKDIKDFDFVVRNVPQKKLQNFLSEYANKWKGSVNFVGQQFGAFKFSPTLDTNLEPFDIVLPRTEKSTGEGGYRSFEITTDPELPIEEDLHRRDLTINAIAYNINTGKIVDPFNGLEYIINKKIRAVTKKGENPENRFREDYSRMLRAIRIACQLNFQIDQDTLKAIENLAEQLNINNIKKNKVISPELISQELTRAFYYNPLKAWRLFNETKLLTNIIPEIDKLKSCEQPENFHAEGNVFTHTELALAHLTYWMNPSEENFQKIFEESFKENQYSEEFKDNYKDLIKGLKEQITKVYGNDEISTLAIFAIMFHDIGKPSTREEKKENGIEKVTFYGHETEGSKIANKICKKLRMSSPKEYGINCDDLIFIVINHMKGTPQNIKDMKPTTKAKFFLQHDASKELFIIHILDALSSIPKLEENDKRKQSEYYKDLNNGHPTLEHLKHFLNELLIIKDNSNKTKQQIKNLGGIIIGIFENMGTTLPETPIRGEIIKIINDEILSGKLDATELAIQEYIKENKNKFEELLKKEKNNLNTKKKNNKKKNYN